jgi:hypothetical protein
MKNESFTNAIHDKFIANSVRSIFADNVATKIQSSNTIIGYPTSSSLPISSSSNDNYNWRKDNNQAIVPDESSSKENIIRDNKAVNC